MIKSKWATAFIKIAHVMSSLSTATKLKVGAVIVQNLRIVSVGYNGTPPGWDNVCEDENGKTKPEVIHAEANAILRAARDGQSLKDTSLFITHAPCFKCAMMIAPSGIKEVYYASDYKNSEGVELLKKYGIKIYKQGEQE